MYSPYQYDGSEQGRKVTFRLPQDIENAQRRLEQQYLSQSRSRPPQTQMSKRYPISYEYSKRYGTPDNTMENQQVGLRNVGKSTLGQIPFSGSTAYKEHFQRHPYQAISLNPELYNLSVPQTPSYPQPKHIKFEGQSTYKADFRNSDIMDHMRLLNGEKINRKDFWHQEHIPFTGNSSYKSSFQPFNVELRHDPPINMQPKNVKFQGKSTYQSDFESFKIETPQKCDVDYLPVPYKNTFSNNRHIYYDSVSNKFT